MSKFGSLNNFQLTRELYNMKEKVHHYETLIKEVETKLKILIKKETDFFENYTNTQKELIDLGIEQGELREKINMLEKKCSNRKLDIFFTPETETEYFIDFLKENQLDYLQEYLISKGVRCVDDILFLTLQDLETDGITLVDSKKLLKKAKEELEQQSVV